MLPHTPLPALSTRTEVNGSALLPRTPYTPFTAFATKQNPFEASLVSGPVHLLDESNDPLAKLYNQILRFIERDFGRIMMTAERVALKAGSTKSHSGVVLGDYQLEDAQQASADSFEIMANVVWAEIGRAIMDELGTVVFAPGNPSEFRKVSNRLSYVSLMRMLIIGHSTIVQHKPSYVLLSSWHLPPILCKPCGPTRFSLDFNDVGSSLYTSS